MAEYFKIAALLLSGILFVFFVLAMFRPVPKYMDYYFSINFSVVCILTALAVPMLFLLFIMAHDAPGTKSLGPLLLLLGVGALPFAMVLGGAKLADSSSLLRKRVGVLIAFCPYIFGYYLGIN